MAFQIRWAEAAARDFEKIASYIENRSGAIESQQVIEALQEAVDRLVDFPYLNQQVGDNPNARRCLCKGFFVVYDISEDKEAIEIVRILRQRRSLPKHL